MRIAIVGATGMVGREMLHVLEEEALPCIELIPVATEASVGKRVRFRGADVKVVGLGQSLSLRPEYALFSAGAATSLKWAGRFADAGTTVIDNSSAWRMDPEVPLVVPEINMDAVTRDSKLIANPNCSTIQLVMALFPLHRAFGLKRIVVSTYQSVTGTGKKALQQLEDEESGIAKSEAVYPYPIHRNCLPHCDEFLDSGYTKEEMKLVNESRKIMGIPDLRLTATAVRVPVVGGHSESVNVQFEQNATVAGIRGVLNTSEGIVVQDDPKTNRYPMPLTAHGSNDVFVGRIRADESADNSFNLWIVADNLRKGAATNAVQILRHLISDRTAET